MSPKRVIRKPSQSAPEDYPGVNDAKRVEGPGPHVDNVGQRRADVEGDDDERIVKHPNDRENEPDTDGQGYESDRSGAV